MSITSAQIQRLRDLQFPVDPLWQGLRSSPAPDGTGVVVHEPSCSLGQELLKPALAGEAIVYIPCEDCEGRTSLNAPFFILLDAARETAVIEQYVQHAIAKMAKPAALMPVLQAAPLVLSATTALRYAPGTFLEADVVYDLPLEKFYAALSDLVAELRATFLTWLTAMLTPYDPNGPERYTLLLWGAQAGVIAAAFDPIITVKGATFTGTVVRSPDLRESILFTTAARSSNGRLFDLGPASSDIPSGAWDLLAKIAAQDGATPADIRTAVAALETACAD